MLPLYPKSLNIETTSICNLKCVMCTHSSSDFGRQKINLTEKIFTQLVEYVKNAEYIQLHGIGEPTLSPMFWKLLDILNEKTWSSVNTNLVKITDEDMTKLVRSNLKHISISIDTPNSNSYYKIRGGDLSKVVENIKKLNDIKNYNNSNILISLNMTIMRENILQLKQAIDLCCELNIGNLDTWPLNNWSGDHLNRNIRNWEFIYDDQIPKSFEQLYNQKLDEAIEYSATKNVKFTYYKL